MNEDLGNFAKDQLFSLVYWNPSLILRGEVRIQFGKKVLSGILPGNVVIAVRRRISILWQLVQQLCQEETMIPKNPL